MSSESVTKQVLTHPVHFLAFGFGSGLSPKAPRYLWFSDHCASDFFVQLFEY